MSSEEFTDEDIQALLPAYASNSLPPAERDRVAIWLEEHPQQRRQVEFWDELRKGLLAQPQPTPRQDVWQGIIHRAELRRRQGMRNAVSALAGLSLAAVTLVLLYFIIRPGVMLQWSVSGTESLTYRVYRAPSGSQDFVLLGEVQGVTGIRQYSYLDALILPGKSYIYRVEALTLSGSPVISQRVVSQSTAALPGQLAILIASLLMGYLAASLARKGWMGAPGRFLPV